MAEAVGVKTDGWLYRLVSSIGVPLAVWGVALVAAKLGDWVWKWGASRGSKHGWWIYALKVEHTAEDDVVGLFHFDHRSSDAQISGGIAYYYRRDSNSLDVRGRWTAAEIGFQKDRVFFVFDMNSDNATGAARPSRYEGLVELTFEPEDPIAGKKVFRGRCQDLGDRHYIKPSTMYAERLSRLTVRKQQAAETKMREHASELLSRVRPEA